MHRLLLAAAASGAVCLATGARGQAPRPADDATVRIPAASFELGVDDEQAVSLARALGVTTRLLGDAKPGHHVSIAAFAIDRYEVTNDRFRRFADANPEWRSPIAGPADWPVVNVTWYAAVAFCRASGRRLPTEAEWEYAARGGLAHPMFPWGDDPPTPARANYGASGFGHAVSVGSYPPNGYGIFDLAGNVWEFVADEWQPYRAEPTANPIAGGAIAGDAFRNVRTRRVVRGGSWGGAPVNLWTGYRDSHPPDNPTDFVGFRCAGV